MLGWYNHLLCFCLRAQADEGWYASLLGGKILTGNYIIRDSSVFTYTESTFRNMWAVLESTIFCISCGAGLPGISSIKFWVPFIAMPRAPTVSNFQLDFFYLEFPHFCNLNFKIFIFQKLLELFERNIFICWNCNINHGACILFEIFYGNVWSVCFYLCICIAVVKIVKILSVGHFYSKQAL